MLQRQKIFVTKKSNHRQVVLPVRYKTESGFGIFPSSRPNLGIRIPKTDLDSLQSDLVPSTVTMIPNKVMTRIPNKETGFPTKRPDSQQCDRIPNKVIRIPNEMTRILYRYRYRYRYRVK